MFCCLGAFDLTQFNPSQLIDTPSKLIKLSFFPHQDFFSYF